LGGWTQDRKSPDRRGSSGPGRGGDGDFALPKEKAGKIYEEKGVLANGREAAGRVWLERLCTTERGTLAPLFKIKKKKTRESFFFLLIGIEVGSRF